MGSRKLRALEIVTVRTWRPDVPVPGPEGSTLFRALGHPLPVGRHSVMDNGGLGVRDAEIVNVDEAYLHVVVLDG